MKTISDILQPKKQDSNLVESAMLEVYENMPYGKIATLIEEYHNVIPTDRIIEKYLELAATRKFSFDPVLFEIRKLNKFDHNLFENKLEFVLEDSSTMAITYECYQDLKEHFSENQEAIEFMTESKDNFMKMFEILNKHKGK